MFENRPGIDFKKAGDEIRVIKLKRDAAHEGKECEIYMVVDVDENGNPKTDADGNIIYTPQPFYPNIIYESGGQIVFYNNHIISEVVLTRGWNAPAPASTKLSTGYSTVGGKKVAPTNVDYSTLKHTKSYGPTALLPQPKKVEAKVANVKQVTPEQTRAGMEKMMKRLNRSITK